MFTTKQLENAYKQPVQFNGTCPANENKTLVSQPILFPFMVTEALVSFAQGCERKLKLELFVSPDDNEPTDAPPNGINLLTYYSQSDYITGDDEQKIINLSSPIHERNQRLKVYATNDDGFDHAIDVLFTILIIPKEA